MLTFATLVDFESYSGIKEHADNIEFLLKRANELVYNQISRNLNQGNGQHMTAAKNSVCAQVMYWVSANVSPVDIAVSSGFSLGDLSMTESSAGATNPVKLCPLALDYLRAEGLTYKGFHNFCTCQEV